MNFKRVDWYSTLHTSVAEPKLFISDPAPAPAPNKFDKKNLDNYLFLT